jgi:molecular chaperone IbpA
MRTYDFSPLFRSSVGFDRVFELLEHATHESILDNWPPYDIEKAGEDRYRITMAVAGFRPDELEVVSENNSLTVRGAKGSEDASQYLYRGIAKRPFAREFELADYVKVASASLENGLLTIDLVREVPEEMKPRRIEIGDGGSNEGKSRIEKHAA